MGRRRLYRSRRERMIAGVAGGLADYFDVDVLIIRLLWILAFFMGGGLVYLIAWFLIPEENDSWERTVGEADSEDQERQWRRSGIILIVAGLFFLLRALLPWPRFRDLIPFILIILGLTILFGGFKRNS